MELIYIVITALVVVVASAVILAYYVSNDIQKWGAANLLALNSLDSQLKSFENDENIARQLVERIVQLPDDPSEIAEDLKNEANIQLQVAREKDIIEPFKKSTEAASAIVKIVDGEIKPLANQITAIADKNLPMVARWEEEIKDMGDEYKRAQQIINEMDLSLPGDDKIVGVGDGYSALKTDFDPASAPIIFSGTSYKLLKADDFISSSPKQPFSLLCAFEFLRAGNYNMQWSIISPPNSKAGLSISIVDDYLDTTNVNQVIQGSQVNPGQVGFGNLIIRLPPRDLLSSSTHLAVFIDLDPNAVDKSGQAWVHVRPFLEEE